ncbi:MAG: 3-oxoacyl-ACP synthase III family protein [Thermodesulfobacteriota bacterium]
MLYLHGMGHFFPENVISNRFISELDIGSDETWILERVGIRTRRTTLPLAYIRETGNQDPRQAADVSLYTHAQMGAKAARMGLDRAGLTEADLGMVVCGTSSPAYAIPALACNVAAELGLEIPCVDINTACSTFVVQLSMVANMVPESLPAFILVVNPECCTHVVDYRDRRVAPLFGDGCSAAIVSRRIPADKWIETGGFFSAPSKWDAIQIPRSGHFRQDGRVVQKFAIRKTARMLKDLIQAHPLGPERLKFIGHQANLKVLVHAAETCGILKDNHWHNVVDYGNTGCGSAPGVLSQNWDRLEPGDHVGMVVVGAGLTWASAMLQVKGE